MTKQMFLSELRTRLSGLPEKDLEERIGFYGEMIDDRIEEGLEEEEAVAGIGKVDDVVSQILADYPLSKIVKEKVKSKHRLQAWEIVLLIVSSPVWLPLLIAAVSVVFSIYIAVWSVVFSLWSAELSVLFVSLGGIVMAVIAVFQGKLPLGLVLFSMGLMGSGCTIFLFFGCKAVTKGLLLLTKKMFLGIKELFVKRSV